MSNFKGLNEYPSRPMTEEETMIMLSLTMSEMGPAPDEGLQEALKQDFLSKVITKRVEVLGNGELSDQLTALIATFSNGNPGRALMYTHAVHMATPKGQISTIQHFADTFPMGLVTDEGFEQAWDGQKSALGNYIDAAEEWIRA